MKVAGHAVYERLELTAYTREAIGNLKVAVVGCGALGAEAARLLGLLGAGSVLLIDPDVIEVSNYTQSQYFRSAIACGRAKVSVLAENLGAHFPGTLWTPLCLEIADTGFQHLRDCSLLFSCTDNVLARVETCFAAYRLGLPMMDAGLKGRAYWAGRVAWLPGGSAACYLCQIGEVRRAELLSLSLSAPHSCSANVEENEGLPSTPTMASVVAGIQVDVGLRLTVAQGSSEARAWEITLPLPEMTCSSFTIPRSRDCPWHNTETSIDLVPLAMDRALDESLAQFESEQGRMHAILELDWPVSLKARCGDCHHVWGTMMRLARFRRTGSCPACAGSRVYSIETLSRVERGEPFAQYTPLELGLPHDHLFTLRCKEVSEPQLESTNQKERVNSFG